MYRTLLWGTRYNFGRYINLVHWQESIGHIVVENVTSNDTMYSSLMGYQFIKKEELKYKEFDLVIILAENSLLEIEKEISLSLPGIDIIPCKVMALPGFTIDKYLKIKKNIPSIISSNCWGGIVYHSLGLPFLSPTVNMCMRENDYLDFLLNLEEYIKEEIYFKEMGEDINAKKKYPIAWCKDISLHFNHSDDFETAKRDWDRRKERIKWDNLLVEMVALTKEGAIQFSKLPYKKKICFVPFSMKGEIFAELPKCEFIHGTNPAGLTAVAMAQGHCYGYDVFDLLQGKITKIIS